MCTRCPRRGTSRSAEGVPGWWPRISSVLRAGPAHAAETAQNARDLLALANYVRFRIDARTNLAFRRIVERVVKHDPNNANALALLANSDLTDFTVSLLPCDLSDAANRLDRALKLDPANLVALWAECFLRRLQGQPGAALDLCRRALDVNPHNPGTLREIGYDLLSLNDANGAIGWFKAAIDANPNHAFVNDAYQGLGESELALGHEEEAIASFREAVRHDHWGNLSGLILAAVLEMSGQHSKASAALAEFRQHHPEFSSPSNGLLQLSAPNPNLQPIIAALHGLGLTQTK